MHCARKGLQSSFGTSKKSARESFSCLLEHKIKFGNHGIMVYDDASKISNRIKKEIFWNESCVLYEILIAHMYMHVIMMHPSHSISMSLQLPSLALPCLFYVSMYCYYCCRFLTWTIYFDEISVGRTGNDFHFFSFFFEKAKQHILHWIKSSKEKKTRYKRTI